VRLDEIEQSGNTSIMDNKIERFKKIGGVLFSQIKNEAGELGWLGYNGVKAHRAYFIFLPNGDVKRFENQLTTADLPAGWTTQQIDDPDVQKQKQKAAHAAEMADLREKEIHLSDEDLFKLFPEAKGRLADFYPVESDLKEVDGFDVACVELRIIYKNEEYDPDEDGSEEFHDAFYINVWRNPKKPTQYDWDYAM
jgi:hypothetical protein